MTTSLKRTPLYQAHVDAGAKLVDFGGFEMPLKYTSEVLEHMAVRQGAGVFDVSHMGEVVIEGPDAERAVQRLVTGDVAAIVDGQCLYAGLLNERGTFIDDVIVNRFSATKFLICVNAGNQDKDFAHIHDVVTREFPGTSAVNEGPLWSQIAVQGPKAIDIVAALAGEPVRAVGGYHFTTGTLHTKLGDASGDVDAILARTGYTGEDGFELYVKNADAPAVWNAVVAHGATPAGLACRDTLRLEAGMALYGNDIDDAHTPLEASLGWIVKLDKREKRLVDFIGAEALRAQKAAGVPRLLRGLEMSERGIPRHGYPILDDSGTRIGEVTSGTQPPFLGRPVAMAYVDRAHSEPGSVVNVEIRGKPVKATVVKLPFYKRAK